jgi:GNAT superfamily N-acetyltransferase
MTAPTNIHFAVRRPKATLIGIPHRAQSWARKDDGVLDPQLDDGVVILRPMTAEGAWGAVGAVRNFGIWLGETGDLVGNVEAHDVGHERVNISYVVFPAWRRQGIATRAVQLVSAYAAKHMGARTAEFKVLPDNEASLAVARRTGARCLGLTHGDPGMDYVLFLLDLRDQPEK